MYRCAPAPANGLPLVKFVTLSYVRCMHALNFTTSRPLIFDFAKYTASITLSKNGNHFNPFLEVGVTLCFCWSLLYAAAANGVYWCDLILTCVCAPCRSVSVGNYTGCSPDVDNPGSFYCYVVDPVSCPIANPSNRFSGAGYRECEPSIEANTTIFVSVLDILANVSSLFCHRNDFHLWRSCAVFGLFAGITEILLEIMGGVSKPLYLLLVSTVGSLNTYLNVRTLNVRTLYCIH